MTNSPDQKTVLETGKDYLDAAVKTVKAHPAATAGIAVGVAAAAAGAAYGATKLRERSAIGEADDASGIIDPQRVPESVPTAA